MAKIILLTGEIEAAFLKETLLHHIKECPVDIVHNIGQLTVVAQQGDRLVSFLSPFIVPKGILEKLQYNCFNFHPAPPSYPGYQPASFAIYEKAKYFGSTFHKMSEKVDSGAIIRTSYFEIKEEWDYIDLSKESFLSLVKLFSDLAPSLANPIFSFESNGEKWGFRKYTQKDYNEKRCIPRNTSFTETQKRFRAFEGIFTPLEKP